MSEIDQAEQEVMQNAEYMAGKVYSLADLSLSVLDENVQNIIENLSKKENEAYGKWFSSGRAIEELKERIDIIEAHNQLQDRVQEQIEADLQSCRPWEFSKKNDLNNQLKEARDTPREDAEPLKQQLREKEEECEKNKTEYKSLKEHREYIKGMMSSKEIDSKYIRVDEMDIPHNEQKTRRTPKR